jgi:hypothetical protein
MQLPSRRKSVLTVNVKARTVNAKSAEESPPADTAIPPHVLQRGFAWWVAVFSVPGFVVDLGVTIWLDVIDQININRADPHGMPDNLLLPHELVMVAVANLAAVLVFVTAVLAVANLLSIERTYRHRRSR